MDSHSPQVGFQNKKCHRNGPSDPVATDSRSRSYLESAGKPREWFQAGAAAAAALESLESQESEKNE